ncbi:hypothetical protein P5V15_015773 [Pogonomyrmex californicus]
MSDEISQIIVNDTTEILNLKAEIKKLKEEDSKLTIAIQLLSYLMPLKQKVKQKGQTGTKKHYNKHPLLFSDIAKEMQTSVQPYIIVVGSIKNVTNSYVTIDEVLYSMESTLETLDVCFKAFHVLKINYPDTNKHLWMLI